MAVALGMGMNVIMVGMGLMEWNSAITVRMGIVDREYHYFTKVLG